MFPVTLIFLAITATALYLRWRDEREPAGHDTPRSQTRSGGSPTCPRCGKWKPGPLCSDCGWPEMVAPGASQRVLKTLQEQLNRLAHNQLLPKAIHERITAAIRAERDQLAAQTAAVAAATAGLAATPTATTSAVADEVPILALAVDQATDAALPPTARAATATTGGGYAVSPQPDAVARAQHYAEQRAAAVAAAQAAPVSPTPPRENLGNLLASFMEERNVRWGELVGGLLIVGCSIALVISFWAEIAARTLLKFGLFNGVAAGLFGIGFYTHRKWKLPTTSRGVLVIATALIPLNFLTIAAFTRGAAANEPLVLAGEAVSIGVFLALSYLAGRLIASPAPAALAAGVMGGSVAQLLVRRWVDEGAAPATLLALTGLALAAHVAAMAVGLWRVSKEQELAESTVNALFRLLGLTAFAALVPAGLLVKLTGDVGGALQIISPLAALFGAPTLAVGLCLWRRLDRSKLSGLRTAGTALAVLGAAIMLGGAWLAWPEPARLVAVGLLDAAALSAVAVAYGISAAHLLAAAAALLAFTAGMAALGGETPWFGATVAETVHAVLSAKTGNLLALLAGGYALGAAAWRRIGRRDDARMYAGVAAVVAVLSVALITWFGFRVAGDPYGATWMYAGYALLTLGAAIGFPVPPAAKRRFDWSLAPVALGWAGSTLLALALIQGFAYRASDPDATPSRWTTALVVHGALALAAGLFSFRWRPAAVRAAGALATSALVTTVAAAALVPYDVQLAHGSAAGIGLATAHIAAIAAVWFVAALARGSATWFALAQLAGFAAATLAVGYAAAGADWRDSNVRFLADTAVWLRVGCAWSVVSAAWLVLRLAMRRIANRPALEELGRTMRPAEASVDEAFAGLALLLLLSLTALAVVPGVLHELTPLAQNTLEAGTPGGDIALPGFVPEQSFRPHGVSLTGVQSRGLWALWALVVGLFAFGHWEDKAHWRTWATLFALALACPLLAAEFSAVTAVASAWRWWAAGAFCLGVITYGQRRPLSAAARRLGWPGSKSSVHDASLLWSVLTATPILVISAHRLMSALVAEVLNGPGASWPLAALGVVPEAAAPLGLVAAGLALLAALRRSSAAACVAGVWANLTVTLAYVLAAGLSNATVGVEPWIGLAHANILTVVAYGGSWLAWLHRSWRKLETTSTPTALFGYVGAGCALQAALLLAANAAMYDQPGNPGAWLTALSGPLGIAALVGSFALALLLARGGARNALAAVTTVGLWATATCGAAAASAWDTSNWLTSHVHLTGFAIVPVAVLLLGWRRERKQSWPLLEAARVSVTRWASVAGGVALCLALRLAGTRDPLQPWWSTAAVATLALLAVALAIWSCRRRFVYMAGALINAALILCLPSTPWWKALSGGDLRVFAWTYANLLAMAAPAAAWLWLERRWIAPRRAALPTAFYLPAHRPLVWLAVLVVILATGLGLLSDFPGGRGLATELPLRYAMLLAVGVATLALFWDAQAREAGAVLYIFGLALVGTYLDRLNLAGERLVWASAMGLAAFTLASSYLWSRRESFFAVGARFKLPTYQTNADDAAPWLVLLNLAVIAVVVTLAYWAELAMPLWTDRFSAGQAATVQAFSLGMLARGRLRPLVQNLALLVGALGIVAVGWSWVGHGRELPVLSYSIATATALVGAAVLYGLLFSKLPAKAGDWPLAAARVTPWVVFAMAACLLAVLGEEAWQFAQQRAVGITSGEIACVAGALLALFAAALAAAVLPGRDPFALSETGRMAYVYVAEAVLALLFLHIRVTLPWLFSGRFLAYWPLVVMAIAFLGVGLGEWFGRRQQNVLAKPLERTGALLPLLPVLGFWFVNSQTHYSLLLLVVGGLYAALAVTRKSFGFGLLAALSANGSLWYYLHHVGGLGLVQHPQLWLIPPALSVLAAAYLNRDRLSPAQMTNIRYLTSTTIYLSSTAEIFLHGVAQAPWSPLVLAGLAIVGVFAGIVLRVRAFLFLGTAFLGLSVLTVVWHAAVDRDQTWVWFASGIVVGLAILTLFAFFEKKREDVLRLVGELKQWQP